jgi:hypothetical protein
MDTRGNPPDMTEVDISKFINNDLMSSKLDSVKAETLESFISESILETENLNNKIETVGPPTGETLGKSLSLEPSIRALNNLSLPISIMNFANEAGGTINWLGEIIDGTFAAIAEAIDMAASSGGYEKAQDAVRKINQYMPNHFKFPSVNFLEKTNELIFKKDWGRDLEVQRFLVDQQRPSRYYNAETLEIKTLYRSGKFPKMISDSLEEDEFWSQNKSLKSLSYPRENQAYQGFGVASLLQEDGNFIVVFKDKDDLEYSTKFDNDSYDEKNKAIKNELGVKPHFRDSIPDIKSNIFFSTVVKTGKDPGSVDPSSLNSGSDSSSGESAESIGKILDTYNTMYLMGKNLLPSNYATVTTPIFQIGFSVRPPTPPSSSQDDEELIKFLRQEGIVDYTQLSTERLVNRKGERELVVPELPLSITIDFCRGCPGYIAMFEKVCDLAADAQEKAAIKSQFSRLRSVVDISRAVMLKQEFIRLCLNLAAADKDKQFPEDKMNVMMSGDDFTIRVRQTAPKEAPKPEEK